MKSLTISWINHRSDLGRTGAAREAAEAVSHISNNQGLILTKLPDPEQRGDLCGRRAGNKFRLAVEQGRPLDSVIAVRPKDMRRARADAYEMIDDPDEAIRDSGRFWRSYWDAFEEVFPDHERYSA